MTTNESAVDWWTLAHVATGFVAARVGVPFGWYFLLSVGFEAIEHQMESPSGSPVFGTKRPESRINVATDLVSGVAGYWLGED